MNAIIFSRNRAMQVDCLLRSMIANFDPFTSVTVLYRADTGQYREGYDIAAARFPDVDFVREEQFRGDFLTLAAASDTNVCLLVDDDIFLREVEPEAVLDLLMANDIVSLRLGHNIAVPQHWEVNGSVDGNIFPAEVLDALHLYNFSNPNSLESKLNRITRKMTMGHLDTSAVIGIPANRVSTTSKTHEMGIGEDMLNTMYLSGMEIDYKKMDLRHYNVHKNEPYAYRMVAGNGAL